MKTENLNDLLKTLNLKKFPPLRFDLNDHEKSILESQELKDIHYRKAEKKAGPSDEQLQLL